MQTVQEQLKPVKSNLRGRFSEQWIWVLCILMLGVTLRLVFFSDAVGSDELVYSEAALRILHGEWVRNEYIGAIRYGINLPVALWVSVFGYGKLGLGGLYFACSIAEIVLAFAFANYLWGNNAALWAAATVAVL